MTNTHTKCAETKTREPETDTVHVFSKQIEFKGAMTNLPARAEHLYVCPFQTGRISRHPAKYAHLSRLFTCPFEAGRI